MRHPASPQIRFVSTGYLRVALAAAYGNCVAV